MLKNGQSASKLLKSFLDNEEGSTTISWEESTVLNKLEKAHIKLFNLKELTTKSSGIYFIIFL